MADQKVAGGIVLLSSLVSIILILGHVYVCKSVRTLPKTVWVIVELASHLKWLFQLADAEFLVDFKLRI